MHDYWTSIMRAGIYVLVPSGTFLLVPATMGGMGYGTPMVIVAHAIAGTGIAMYVVGGFKTKWAHLKKNESEGEMEYEIGDVQFASDVMRSGLLTPEEREAIRRVRRMRTAMARQADGFTLIELIVALAIVAFMVLSMNTIFNEAVGIVRRGTQTGEIIQRARGLDQQLKAELAMDLTAGIPEAKMVGPLGNDNSVAGTAPGGFLAIVQHVIPGVALTDEDATSGNLRPIRSDQLMFVIDQNATPTGGAGKLRALAPANDQTFGGNAADSGNALYARMWYGHVQMLHRDGTPAADLGDPTPGNPNRYAVNWVLGRHALFLTDTTPQSAHYVQGFLIGDPVAGYGGPMSDGLSDVSNAGLDDVIAWLDMGGSPADYHARVLTGVGFADNRLMTQAKPGLDLDMTAEQFAPMHTAFMTGVSDFIVEWAGDMYTSTGGPTWTVDAATLSGRVYHPDGLLDRDENGAIVWYSHFPNHGPGRDMDMPVTWVPPGGDPMADPYKPYNAFPGGAPAYADGAFVWQPEGSSGDPTFDSVNPPANAWPWLIRIRYRLHDRRGGFVGRRIEVGGQEIEERGQWFSTIVSVNRQYPLP